MSDSLQQKLLQVLVPPLTEPLTYLAPENNSERLKVGSKVSVPLGSRRADGFVISINLDQQTSPSNFKLKPIHNHPLNQVCFDHEQLKFFNWIAQYYAEPLANVLDVAIPTVVAPRSEQYAKLVDSAAGQLNTRSRTQKGILELLQASKDLLSLRSLKQRFKSAQAALKKLEALGIIQIVEGAAPIASSFKLPAPSWAKTEVKLDSQQSEALDLLTQSIAAARFGPYLLHGVTGSGKTEVYIEAILSALKTGKGSLVIVPEIALTPQLVDRFRARLGDNISILHSALSKRERWEAWQALLDARNKIAIGTRSAVFAPVRDLGLIVVDEEHDHSFKQSDGLRYNARDLAVMRAKFQNCTVVLGSATPSLESCYNAQSGKFTRIALSTRPAAAAQLYTQIVDLNGLKPWDMPSKNISPQLCQALSEVLTKGEQAFILYNRRGFATYLQCEKCEEVLLCPNCSVSLTYHQSSHALTCHYCNLSITPPVFCSACSLSKSADSKSARLVQRGAGTEKIFEELQALFPTARIERLDRDSAHDHKRYREILDGVRNGQTQILVGTQMIAKGHDLPLVTLVGVADCDVGLHMPDFRAAERAFQLLTQAAGRAGRSQKAGRVILQTRAPQHPALLKTAVHDFEGFSRLELKIRRSLNYPPYSKLLRIIAASQVAEASQLALNSLRKQSEAFIKKEDLGIQILGPAPAPLLKLKTHYRWHLLCKSKSSSHLNRLLVFLKGQSVKSKMVRVNFDLDPQEML